MEAQPVKQDKTYITTSQVIKGVLSYLQAEKLDQAASLYSNCREDVGFVLMNKVPDDRSLKMRMAKMFFMAKDYEKSALMLEGMGEHKRAAELYERTDQYEQAAQMWAGAGETGRAAHNYEKAGRWQTAAELYLQAQNYERAAYCFERAVNHFLAGKYYFQIKKYEKSMELLQKVRKEEESYLEAAVLIGNVLAMNGQLDMAVAKYKAVARSVPIAKGSLSVYYNLAQLLERKGELGEAARVYRKVAAIDPAYREVGERLGKLEAEAAAEGEVEIIDLDGHEDLEVIEELEPIEEELPGEGQPRQAQARIVSVMEGFEFLKSTAIFDGLSLSEMKQMWNITGSEEFGPGEMIIEQDRPGEALFIIKRGSVKVQRAVDGKTAELAELGPGAHVGEMSLIDDAPTSARVVAGPEGAAAFKITRERFEELLDSDDKIAIKLYKVFIQSLCNRLRKTTSDLSEREA